MDYFKLKCRDYKELNTLKMAQWEKRVCVAFEKKSDDLEMLLCS